MKSRRDFLKGAATGAVILGAESGLGLTRTLEPQTDKDKATVVIARDPALHGPDGKLDEKRVGELLDRAITAYTGRAKPVDAWKRIVLEGGAKDKVIGLKTNGLGGKGISTHAVLVYAIAERLQAAGVKPGNILIWDRNARDLQACGLTISTDPSRVRCFGSDVSGFDDVVEKWGSSHARFSKILTSECAMVINLPILKDHSMSGVTFAMKNMYGVVERPQDLHGGRLQSGRRRSQRISGNPAENQADDWRCHDLCLRRRPRVQARASVAAECPDRRRRSRRNGPNRMGNPR